MLTAVFFPIGVFVALANPQGSFFSALGLGYVFGCLPFGWRSLPRATLGFFLVIPLFGWILYFSVKLTLAWVVGAFVGPFKIYQAVRGLKEAAALEASTR